jgi:hypothetical protein
MKLIAPFLLLLTACRAEKNPDNVRNPVACPSEVTEKSRFKPEVQKYGIFLGDKILYAATLVTGGPSDTIHPAYAEDPPDEWEDSPEGARAVVEYDPGTHDGMNLLCDYFPKGKYDGRAGGFQKPDGRVTLLLPLPDPAGLKCTFIRNPDKDKFSGKCELK